MTRGDVAALGETLSAVCRHAVGVGGEAELGLTAGRDSRVILALLLSGGVPARCFTSGRPASADVTVAARLAAHVGWEHSAYELTADDIARAWPLVAPRMVAQLDGLVSLSHVAAAALERDEPTREPVLFSGLGGEIAREFYGDATFVRLRPSTERIYQQLAPILVRTHGGLLRREALVGVERHVREFIARSLAERVAPEDVATAYYMKERVRRWGGSTLRLALSGSLLAPFCVRPFVEAAWSLTPTARLLELLHRDLLRSGRPDLLAIPFEKRPLPRFPEAVVLRWRLESLARALLPWRVGSGLLGRRPAGTGARGEQAEWLEGVRPRIRERCLDHHNHFLWDLVDRGGLERLTTAGPAHGQIPSQTQGVFDAATLFYYFASCEPAASTARGSVSR